MIEAIMLFIICILASSIGAVVGAGGGVIIKPVLDMIGLLPVSTVSFCSGCTVLGMSVCSLIRNRKDGVKLQLKMSTALAIGAVLGGLLGKWLFDLLRSGFGNEQVLGAVQAVALTIVTFGTFLYICNKDKLPSMHVDNIAAAVLIGAALGVISSFLGIGGGTNNVAVLFFFFSMEAKEAAKNSIFIIIFSQVSSILSAILTNSVPDFSWLNLIFMVAGGIGGALVGAAISRRIDNRGVEKLLKLLSLAIVLIGVYNILKYTVLYQA